MFGQQNESDNATFKDFAEGLYVRIPAQTNENQGRELRIARMPFGNIPPDGFTMVRPLVNFKVLMGEGTVVNDFVPPMELLVRFTQEDLELAATLGEEPLVFAYYDPGDKDDKTDVISGAGWTFPLDVTPIRFPLTNGDDISEGFGGYHFIRISNWPGDPGNGWGVK